MFPRGLHIFSLLAGAAPVALGVLSGSAPCRDAAQDVVTDPLEATRGDQRRAFLLEPVFADPAPVKPVTATLSASAQAAVD